MLHAPFPKCEERESSAGGTAPELALHRPLFCVQPEPGWPGPLAGLNKDLPVPS